MQSAGIINRRVLVVDDAPAIHEDFRETLAPDTPPNQDLDATEVLIFGVAPRPIASFEPVSAFQGQQALEMVAKSLLEERPYLGILFTDSPYEMSVSSRTSDTVEMIGCSHWA